MKVFVVFSICFVFVSQAAGQRYGDRRVRNRVDFIPARGRHHEHNPGHIIDDSVPPHGVIPGGELPPEVQAVIGTTITRLRIQGGVDDGFPVHGGTLNENGLQGSWGRDPAEPVPSDITSWSDPMRGAEFPADFQGGPLILNEDRNRWEREHQQAKATNYIRFDSNRLMPGVGHQRHVENKIAEQQVHNAAQQTHNAVKSGAIQAGRPSYIGRGHGIPTHQASNVQHNIIKSSVGAIGPISGTSSVIHESPVHRVHKVSKSGVAAVGHDRLAVNIGKAVAQKVISQSSNIVDIGSNGGVSSGNQIASAAALGLAREAGHIVNDILNTASQSNIGHGQNIIGGIHPIPTHPKPINPKPAHANQDHPKPVHANVVHHSSVHHSSVHHKPTNPKPFYPKSLHPKSTHPKQVHPKSVQPKPVHPKPSYPKPVHHSSVHHSSVHHTVPQHKPVHPKTVHPKPGYPKQAHQTSVHHSSVHHTVPQHKPIQPKSVHPKPAYPKQGHHTSGHHSSGHHSSVHHSSVHHKPTNPKPFYPKSLHSKSTNTKPVHANVAHHSSVHHSSVHHKPTNPKPFYPKSLHPKPSHPKPVQPKPVHPKPSYPKPVHHSSVHHSSVHHSSVHHTVPQHKPVQPKPVHPKPAYPKQVHSNSVHHSSVHHSSVHHTVPQHKPVQPKSVHPKPAYPKKHVKKPKVNTGYGRRY